MAWLAAFHPDREALFGIVSQFLLAYPLLSQRSRADNSPSYFLLVVEGKYFWAGPVVPHTNMAFIYKTRQILPTLLPQADMELKKEAHDNTTLFINHIILPCILPYYLNPFKEFRL